MVAALIAALYMRSRAFQTFLSISLALPVIRLILFIATVPLATDDHEGVDIEVDSPAPVVLVVFDEFPISSIMAERLDQRDPIPEPRAPRARRDVVSASDHRGRLDDECGSCNPHGQASRPGTLPTLADHPDNIFTFSENGSPSVRANN